PPPSDPSDLRRSKRNKFHLDVATMHLMHPERSRKHNANSSSPSPLPKETKEDKVSAPPVLSPQVMVKEKVSGPPILSPQMELISEGKKRKIVEGEEDEDEEEMEKERETEKRDREETNKVTKKEESPRKRKNGRGERNRPHKCSKCPASFDSMISLELHSALHGSRKKHKCDVCDYASNSLHAVKTHIMMHRTCPIDRFGYVPSSPNISPLVQSNSLLSVFSSKDHSNPLQISIHQEESSSIEREEEAEEEESPVAAVNEEPTFARIQATLNGKYKCGVCPFTTRDNERLERHNYGHSRGVGFLCPLCTFKSESAGFLKRHVEIHGVADFQWPPTYVGISPRLNKAMEEGEKKGPPTLLPIGKILKAAHHASIPREKIGAAVNALQSSSSQSPLLKLSQSSTVLSTIDSLMSTVATEVKKEENGGNSPPSTIGNKRKIRMRIKRNEKKKTCRVEGCTHSTTSRARHTIHTIVKHYKKKVVSRRLCGECGVLVNGGEGGKRVHWERRHGGLRWTRNTINRLIHERCGTTTKKRYEQPDLLNDAPILIRDKYQCTECPYSAPIRSRLDRHRPKHTLREGYNCKYCSFSCRSDELILTHEKIHEYRIIDRSEMKEEMSSAPTPEPSNTLRMDTESPPALERAESSMGGGDDMPVLESNGTPPILEAEVEMRVEKRGRKKKKVIVEVEKKEKKEVPVQLKLIEKVIQIRNVGVIGIKRIGGISSRRYKCIHCPFTTPFLAFLWKHSRYHLSPSPSSSSSLHRCSECTFSSSLLSVFSSHLSMHSLTRTTFPCEFCPFVGTSSDLLDDHIVSTGHGTPPIPVEDPTRLQMGRCRGDKPISFNLISSRKWMIPSKEEKRLLRMVNRAKNTREHHCTECPFSDPDQLMFNLHMRMHEGPKQPFECNVCSYSAASAEGLHHHISLHIPPDSIPKRGSTSSRAQTIRRRQSTEVIPSGVHSFDCSTCNFRTIDQAAFHVHKLEHAKHIQQRLVTQIKRAAANEENTKKKPKMKAITMKSMKQIPCLKCDFLCETASAFVRHTEFHGSRSPFACHICDYASATKQITDFHVLHHHTKKPLAHLIKQATLMPESSKLVVDATLEDKVRLAGQIFCCQLCDRQFLEMRLLLTHWEVDHSRRGDDTACHLSLGMLPTNRILTKA
ncbi:hypothetical protein PFISCL1PPCAC_19702, partial [Pristionchus fissidentatus]